MLLLTLAATLLVNVLITHWVINVFEGVIRVGQNVQSQLILQLNLKYKNIKRDQNLLVLIQEINYLNH